MRTTFHRLLARAARACAQHHDAALLLIAACVSGAAIEGALALFGGRP
jgi:hypothetical protein